MLKTEIIESKDNNITWYEVKYPVKQMYMIISTILIIFFSIYWFIFPLYFNEEFTPLFEIIIMSLVLIGSILLVIIMTSVKPPFRNPLLSVPWRIGLSDDGFYLDYWKIDTRFYSWDGINRKHHYPKWIALYDNEGVQMPISTIDKQLRQIILDDFENRFQNTRDLN